MPPALRRLALTAHVTASVGWLGSVAVFLALAVTGLTRDDAEMVRAAYLAMDVAADVVVPLALASLATGLVQSLGTHWGLVRHYWVVVKLVVTVVAVVVLLLQVGSIDHVAGLAAHTTFGETDAHDARVSLAVHAGAGLLVLLVPLVLSIYKPRGLTRYGRRRL